MKIWLMAWLMGIFLLDISAAVAAGESSAKDEDWSAVLDRDTGNWHIYERRSRGTVIMPEEADVHLNGEQILKLFQESRLKYSHYNNREVTVVWPVVRVDKSFTDYEFSLNGNRAILTRQKTQTMPDEGFFHPLLWTGIFLLLPGCCLILLVLSSKNLWYLNLANPVLYAAVTWFFILGIMYLARKIMPDSGVTWWGGAIGVVSTLFHLKKFNILFPVTLFAVWVISILIHNDAVYRSYAVFLGSICGAGFISQQVWRWSRRKKHRPAWMEPVSKEEKK